MSHKDSSYATTQCGIDILESIRLIGRQRDGLEHRLEENCMLITNAIMTLEAYSSILSSGYTYVSREMQFRKAEKSKFLTPNPKPRSCARVYAQDLKDRQFSTIRCSIKSG
jgi:hypothetical protein